MVATMLDVTALAEGMAIFKAGMEGLKVAFGLAKDIRSSLPADKQAEVSKALELSEQHFAFAEA